MTFSEAWLILYIRKKLRQLLAWNVHHGRHSVSARVFITTLTIAFFALTCISSTILLFLKTFTFISTPSWTFHHFDVFISFESLIGTHKSSYLLFSIGLRWLRLFVVPSSRIYAMITGHKIVICLVFSALYLSTIPQTSCKVPTIFFVVRHSFTLHNIINHRRCCLLTPRRQTWMSSSCRRYETNRKKTVCIKNYETTKTRTESVKRKVYLTRTILRLSGLIDIPIAIRNESEEREISDQGAHRAFNSVRTKVIWHTCCERTERRIGKSFLDTKLLFSFAPEESESKKRGERFELLARKINLYVESGTRKLPRRTLIAACNFFLLGSCVDEQKVFVNFYFDSSCPFPAPSTHLSREYRSRADDARK